MSQETCRCCVGPTASDGAFRRFRIKLLGLVFGLIMLYGVGFAQPQAIHDATHDSRHATAFPCH